MSSTRIEKIQREKVLTRIHWPTVKRIVTGLHENNGMRKTTIAGRCRVPYERCVMYLKWCIRMKWIEIKENIEGHELFILTERGRELYVEECGNDKTIFIAGGVL